MVVMTDWGGSIGARVGGLVQAAPRAKDDTLHWGGDELGWLDLAWLGIDRIGRGHRRKTSKFNSLGGP